MKKGTAILLAILVLLPVMSFAESLFTVNNNTNTDMVLFAGNVAKNNVLGTVKAMSTGTFDISKIKNAPDEGAFILNAVSATVYQKNKKNISSSDILYSGFVNYDKKDSLKKQITIPDAVDVTASTCVIVSNNSKTVCLIRLNSPDGIAITALRPGEQSRRIWIVPSPTGYLLFPNFIGYENGSIINIYATDAQRRVNPENPVETGRSTLITLDNRESPDTRISLFFE